MNTELSTRRILKTGILSSTPSGRNENGGGGVIIEESQESEEYQQDLQVVVATACSVIAVVGLIALAFFVYRIYRARRRALSYGQPDDNENFDNNFSVEVVEKSQPIVLVLYSNDCPMHEQVVKALASFLMETCGVTVTLDLLEETEILERGVDDWLVDRLQEADYILVICSLGARLRCSKKKICFKHEGRRLLPDYFAVAVDYTAEKMRVEKQKGLSSNKFLTAYMEYSTRSDIPPQLETAAQFCLMKDIHALHTHLNTYGPDKSDSGSEHSSCENHYHDTETGAILKATLEQAKTYFKENPDWMHQRLQEVPQTLNRMRKHRRKSSMEQPLLVLTGRPPVLTNYSNYSNNQQNGSQHFPVSPPCHVDSGPLQDSDSSQCRLQGSGVFQGRQNSLPSSLSSVPHQVEQLSKSMDSFNKDIQVDGLPCFYCNCNHSDGRSMCRRHRGSLSDLRPASQCSVDGLSRSQTILQAEVHQEWGPDQKSVTLEPRQDCRPWIPFQSLPPHQAPPCSPSSTEWDDPSSLHRWHHQTTIPESPNLAMKPRTMSETSFTTEDSESVSETDSLERDLRSIQHITSFQDFVASSSFVAPSSLKTSSIEMRSPQTEIRLPYKPFSPTDVTHIVL